MPIAIVNRLEYVHGHVLAPSATAAGYDGVECEK